VLYTMDKNFYRSAYRHGLENLHCSPCCTPWTRFSTGPLIGMD
jgi:hypothetical protein